MNRHAIMETTFGTLEIELFEDKAPLTTANFVKLAQSYTIYPHQQDSGWEF